VGTEGAAEPEGVDAEGAVGTEDVSDVLEDRRRDGTELRVREVGGR
jgi:hypothetical protein